MSNDLVSASHNPLVAAGDAISRAISSPQLSRAEGGRPRTILLGRMLSGADASDLIMAHLLCLAHSENISIALFGDPAGPTFKTHPSDLRARFDPADAGAVGAFIDCLIKMGHSHIIASFDPSCSAELIQAIELLHDDFRIPIAVVFVATRDEGAPGLVTKIRQAISKVIVARPALRSKFEMTNDLEIPALSEILAKKYNLAQCSLRELVGELPFGSRAVFQSELRKFSGKLEVMLHE